MKRRKKKYFSRKFQVIHHQDFFFIKHFLFMAALALGGITLLYGLKNYQLIKPDHRAEDKKENKSLAGLRVRILNASGESDLPQLLADKLKNNDVIAVIERLPGQNLRSPTVIIHRTGKLARIKKLGDYLGCQTVITKIDPNDTVDAIVIIGKDLRTLRK